MKTTLKTLAIAIIFTNFSCQEPVSESIHFRTIINESGHIVEINVDTDEPASFTIEPGDSLLIKGTCYSGPGTHYCDIGWSDNENVTAKIIFEGERELIYSTSNCNGDKNLIADIANEPQKCGYINRNDNGISEYVFEIIEDDYLQAIPIN